jgi:glycosyltransferase involved in cell wall biosynthesis
MVRKAAYPVFHMLRRKALARTTRILVSTPSAIAELPKRYRPNVEIQPPGVDETRFSVHPFPTTPTVIYVGRLEPVKRVSELIEAFGILAPELPEARLLLVGDGPERSFLESRCVELGIANAVTLTGNVPHSGIPAFLARSTVLCLPSHGEPLGMVVLEAMATGRPVVAVANGGPAWLIKQDIGGVLAPSGTAGELAAGLLRVLRDRQLAEAMGGYNRTRVASEFGLARLVQVLERAYAGA